MTYHAVGADGLCGDCAWARIIRSDRGARFILCRFSEIDPNYSKYPALPVRECPAYEPRPEEGKTS